jgi:hypothetical protein
VIIDNRGNDDEGWFVAFRSDVPLFAHMSLEVRVPAGSGRVLQIKSLRKPFRLRGRRTRFVVDLRSPRGEQLS